MLSRVGPSPEISLESFELGREFPTEFRRALALSDPLGPRRDPRLNSRYVGFSLVFESG